MKKIALRNWTLPSLFFLSVMSVTTLSCSKDDVEHCRIIPKASADGPKSINECSSSDIAALNRIFQPDKNSNNQVNLDNFWSGVKVKWEKHDTTYVVTGITILPENTTLSDIQMGINSGNIFNSLDTLIIKSAHIENATISDQPNLKYLMIDGLSNSNIKKISAERNRNIKSLFIQNLPKVKELELSAGKMHKIAFINLPELINVNGVRDIIEKDKGNDTIHCTIDTVAFAGNMKKLDYVYLFNKDIKNLQISPDVAPSLTTLTISNNSIKGKLSLDGFSSLTSLYARSNNLQGISLNNCINLQTLDLSRNRHLTAFSVEGNTKLKHLTLDGVDGLKVLDLSKYKSLKWLSICESGITNLNIANQQNEGPQIEHLSAYGNRLETFEYPEKLMIHMISLSIRDNRLRKVDISNMSKIETLDISNNVISELILPEESESYEHFDHFFIQNNHLPIETLEKLYNQCDRPGTQDFKTAPQFDLSHQDTEKKLVDFSSYKYILTEKEYDDDITTEICVVKWNPKENTWIYLEREKDYRIEGNIVKLDKAPEGKYRIGISGGWGTFMEDFTPQNLYVLGEFEIHSSPTTRLPHNS